MKIGLRISIRVILFSALSFHRIKIKKRKKEKKTFTICLNIRILREYLHMLVRGSKSKFCTQDIKSNHEISPKNTSAVSPYIPLFTEQKISICI